jgi:hypothetical protein
MCDPHTVAARRGSAPPRRTTKVESPPGGIEKDVTLADADTKLNEEIDRAYRTKYRRNGQQYVNMMT